MISRVKQLFFYLFVKYDKKNDVVVKKILNRDESEVFDKMSNYDKVHSFRLYKFVEENCILKNDEIYKKLALLHDCGKERVSLYRRIKKVLWGDKKLEQHSEIGYNKLKDINYELAMLIKNHHTKNYSTMMGEFQKLDDK